MGRVRPESAPVADPHPEAMGAEAGASAEGRGEGQAQDRRGPDTGRATRRRSDSRPAGADGWRDRCRSSRFPALPLDNGRGMRDNGFVQLLSTDDCIQSSECCIHERRLAQMQTKRERQKKKRERQKKKDKPYTSRISRMRRTSRGSCTECARR
ncbi:hypothetical protein GCM10010341_50020 [Streptomyces noursei]|nr:hypothetical protein GCM10010341_50020 [Streptomyces noursei]